MKQSTNMGVSKNRGVYPPKWMVKIMENPMNKWMIWGETPLFFGLTPICIASERKRKVQGFSLDSSAVQNSHFPSQIRIFPQIFRWRKQQTNIETINYCWWFRNPAITSWYGKYPMIYGVSYISSGAGFQPSTVSPALGWTFGCSLDLWMQFAK